MFCLNRNYPSFNHKDTLLLKTRSDVTSETPKHRAVRVGFEKDRKFNSIYFPSRTPQSIKENTREIDLPKFINLQNSTHIASRSTTKNPTKLPRVVSHSSENNHSATKHPLALKAKLFPWAERISILKTIQKKTSKKEVPFLDDKTSNFLDYLTFLKNNKAQSLSKTVFSKEAQSPKKNDHRSSVEHDFSEISVLKSAFGQNKNKKASFAFMESNNDSIRKEGTLNSIPSNINNGSRSSLCLSSKLRKRGSISLGSHSRMFRIRNYQLLMDVILKISKNLTVFLQIVSNERKAYKLISDLLRYNRSMYLEKLFFIDGKEQFQENLSPSALENACFFKESQFDVSNKTQIYEEKLISPTIIQDLIVINEKIEGYLVERHINEMKNLTEDLTVKLKKLARIELEKFNYETMPDHSLIDDIIDLRNQFGNLENFDKKELIIGKTIDEMIKNVKSDNEGKESYFNALEIKRK